jgi:glycerol-3-phosphate acyltransferase PlsX
MTTILSDMTAQEMDRQGLSSDERNLVAGVLSEVQKGFDPEDRGGAPLLGVNGNVLIGHGRSSPDAISGMIHFAVDIASHNVVETMKGSFGSSG